MISELLVLFLQRARIPHMTKAGMVAAVVIFEVAKLTKE
ncbi:hypothetical protein PBI_COUNT_55 [Microbacterium phage Count]|nr:hypothetical protein PBI_COUNT_55 [Microbacterium phage Count]